MQTDATSLRRLIDKWMCPAAGMPARIKRMARSQVNRHGCVRVEITLADGPLAFFFFRHGNGFWYVFPQRGAS